ncbi:MAG: trypsin-like peptidase domain-containing protein [Candidatus Sungbacteria bacterium]|uniref:Trypsin-like peptidase domain-containing protein n=1 Tax=Candidatus Sungiibacteriota bacterium TaxID=2750080 RepID=A0A9D6HSN9_9BACT|nr:trypsin-like peptidase domain-containing protein [Candidatus Sungbacteria bacterium]
MRFFVYLLMILAGFVFFIYRQENFDQPDPITPLSPISSPVTPLTDTATATPTKKTENPATQPTSVPAPKPQPAIDQNTLDQIQAKLNQTTQALQDLEKPAPLPPARISQEELYNKAATRVVNFFCQQGNQIKAASGIIISPAGHILTNAHVAEGYDGNFECAIRQGSPARNLGYAKIVMFPQAYALAATRQEQADNDVSIWKLTRLANGDPLPKTMDYYSIDPTYYPQINQPLSTFSYPSELLGYETILRSLNMFFAETIVNDFDRDLILSSTGLSSQVGSSGGILVDVYTNQFAGLIFAVSKDEEISKRKLFSLTPFSVNRVVQTETGFSLDIFLSK